MLNCENKGIKFEKIYLNNFCLADDVALITDDLREAKDMLKKRVAITRNMVQINADITKMITNLVPSQNIRIGQTEIELTNTHIWDMK